MCRNVVAAAVNAGIATGPARAYAGRFQLMVGGSGLQ